VRAYYELQLETRRRHGVPAQPWRFFKLFGERLVKNGYSSILLAYQAGRCIAGLVLLHWNQTIICKYAASREETMILRPNNLLFWTAIQWGCENGYKVFDFGRSDLDNPGLCRFKRGWGAEETMLTYQVISTKPEKQVSGKLLKVVRPVIRRSPRWVCQMAGELFYKFSG
jgi:predicted N-acyltransferase